MCLGAALATQNKMLLFLSVEFKRNYDKVFGHCCSWLVLEKNLPVCMNFVFRGRSTRVWMAISFTKIPERGMDCLMDSVIFVIFYILQSILSFILYVVFH